MSAGRGQLPPWAREPLGESFERMLGPLGVPVREAGFGRETRETGSDGRETARRSESGPEHVADRVADMEGGSQFLLARRRARRRDLVKEAVNVVFGSVVAWIVGGVLLWTAGASADTTVAVASALAGALAWILGRDVLRDLARNEEIVKRGGTPR